MLVIRLFRVGKKNQPSFKIVVTNKKKSSKRGRFVEEVGFYNPLTKEKVLRNERIKYWLSVGAKPSDTVFNLLISGKVIEGKKIDVHKKSKKTVETIPTTPASVAPTPEKSVETKAEEKPAAVIEAPVQEAPKEETVSQEKPKEAEPVEKPVVEEEKQTS